MKVVKVIWHETALEHYNYWKENDPDKVERIKNLILSIKQSPFKGIGKPEPLKGDLSGLWSRRINKEHRLVYKVSDVSLTIYQCRFHY